MTSVGLGSAVPLAGFRHLFALLRRRFAPASLRSVAQSNPSWRKLVQLSPPNTRWSMIVFKPGFDADIIAGYDFGMVRVEGELGYKRASLDEIEVRDQPGTGLGFGSALDADGSARALSVMINALLDFGDEDSWSGYVGPGIGLASAKYTIDSIDDPEFGAVDLDDDISETRLAWQVVAGVRTAITPTLDLGVLQCSELEGRLRRR